MDGRRVVLLRAVNVGGATLPMAELRELATALGATDVATHIASGNLLCRPPGDPADFDRALERAIEQRFGFFREAISRSPAELAAARAAFPFAADEPRFAAIVFLLAEPAPDTVAAAREVDVGPERWEVIGREMHLRYAHGAGRAHPGLDRVSRRLQVPGTARNLNTVDKLIALSSPDA